MKEVEPITVLVLMLTSCGAVFYVLRWLWRRGGKSAKAISEREKKQVQQEKDQALERFREIHARARDHRKQLVKEIDHDPERAAELVKKMLKQ